MKYGDYYDEMDTYKREDQAEYGDEEYGEEQDENRALIERNVEATYCIEKPHKDVLKPLYEAVMQSLIDLIELINDDGMSFVYKQEQQRIYNLLMAVVVNDKQKSQKVCQMLG